MNNIFESGENISRGDKVEREKLGKVNAMNRFFQLIIYGSIT